MRLASLILITILCSTIVLAQGATWQPVPLKYTWDYRDSNFCPSPAQCLVDDSYNDALNNQPDLFFQTAAASELPRCIDDSQFILDHLCVNGSWSSRTRSIAESLLSVVSSAGLTQYELFCDKYPSSLNSFDYFEGTHLVLNSIGICNTGIYNKYNCANNFCVLTYPGGAAFGVSLNKPIDDSSDSFLYALGESRTLCNNVPSSNQFSSCGANIYYNPVLNSVIFVNATLAAPAPKSFIDGLYSDLQTYARTPGYSVFNYTPSFNQLRIGRDASEFVFSFKQKGVGTLNEQFAGWYFYNVSLPPLACDRVFKQAGNPANVYCYSQPKNTSYNVVSTWNSALPNKGVTVDWSLFSGSMRVVS